MSQRCSSFLLQLLHSFHLLRIFSSFLKQSAKSKTYKNHSSKSSKSKASKKFALFEKSGKGKGGKSITSHDDDEWGGAINAVSYLEYAPVGSEDKSSGHSPNGLMSWTVVVAVIFLGSFLVAGA